MPEIIPSRRRAAWFWTLILLPLVLINVWLLVATGRIKFTTDASETRTVQQPERPASVLSTQTVAAADKPADVVPADLPNDPAPAPLADNPVPPPRVAAIAQAVDKPANFDHAIQVEDPAGELTIPDLKRKRWKLSGHVGRLVVGVVDERSAVDASELTAKEIVLMKKIEAGSWVHVRAPQGTVEVRDKIYDGSKLTVDAPQGKVDVLGRIDNNSTLVISAPQGVIRVRGKIHDRAVVTLTAPQGAVYLLSDSGGKVSNQSQLTITASLCDLQMSIFGAETRALVTLIKPGELKFRELRGDAHLHYRKDNPADPEPKITAGQLADGADFRPAP